MEKRCATMSWKRFLGGGGMRGLWWKGVAVGVTETVPWISGSTVAMMVGIYETNRFAEHAVNERSTKGDSVFSDIWVWHGDGAARSDVDD